MKNNKKYIQCIENDLERLDLSNNQITKIENLNYKLEKLLLYNNKITKIENLNQNLEILYLSNNQITKIENLNENLEILDLSNNQITKIENLNENLEVLSLSYNQITKIENLNENLEILYLYNNPVKQITRESYDLIKKNNIEVYGVDIDYLEIEDDIELIKIDIIEDIVNKVPKEKLDFFLKDLKFYLEYKYMLVSLNEDFNKNLKVTYLSNYEK